MSEDWLQDVRTYWAEVLAETAPVREPVRRRARADRDDAPRRRRRAARVSEPRE